MSADDFQTKYASVMESMLKSAVAETTKLFETMVDELKAEISRIKKENEDLKTRCSQFENARKQTTKYIREREHVPRRKDGSEKRDTAVQCDLVPLRLMLVEQCEPLRPSSLQNQEHQCDYDAMQYVLQEHNYENRGERNSEMACDLVKQEGSLESRQQSVFKQEKIGPTESYRQALSDKAGSPRTSACGIEHEGHLISQEYSTAEKPLPEETQGPLEVETGMDSSFLEVHNKSSLAALKGDVEDSEVHQKILEIGTQQELLTSTNHPLAVIQHRTLNENEYEQQLDGKISGIGQTDVDLRQLADVQYTDKQFSKLTPPNKGEVLELKSDVSEGEVNSQPNLPVPRRRGRPPKKAKHLQQPAKHILLPASPTTRAKEVEVSSAVDSVSVTSSEPSQECPIQPEEPSSTISLSVHGRANTALEIVKNSKVGTLTDPILSLSSKCSSEKKKISESLQLSMDMESDANQTQSSAVLCTVETTKTPTTGSPQTPSVQSRERRTSVTLQDAMLLVEAMNQSTEENTLFSPQKIATKTQIKCATCVGTLQAVIEVQDEPRTVPIPVEVQEVAGNVPITELSTTQLTKEEVIADLQTTDATAIDEALAQKKVTPKQQHMVILSNIAKSSIPASTAATQTSVHSLQHHPSNSLIKSVAHHKQGNAVPHKIIVMSRSLASLMPCKFPAQSPIQPATVVSTAVNIAATDKSETPSSTPTVTHLGKPSFSSVTQKTICIASNKSLNTITSQSTGPSTDSQPEKPSHSKITIIIPRQQSTVASRKLSQSIALTTKQESAKSAHTDILSSSQSMSSSQEFSVSVDAQTTLDRNVVEMATISSTKQSNNSDNQESPKRTASLSESINESKASTSSVNMSAGLVPTSMSPVEPPTIQQKLCAVVRLTRLPFQMPTKEAVLLSSVPTNGSCETQSILKEGITVEKHAPMVIPIQQSEIQVLSSGVCSNSKDNFVAVRVPTSQMSEKPSNMQEKVSSSSENGPVLDESVDNGYVQTSTPAKWSAPIFEKSTIAIKTTKPSDVNGMAGEPMSSNMGKEKISIAVQDCSLPNGPPIEQQSPDIIHLMSIKSKDTCDPHLQMTKTQFLAQLAVSPVQDPKKACTNDTVDAKASCPETSSTYKKRLQNSTLVAKLRSHLKNHLQARSVETNQETCTETESLIVNSPDDKSTTCEPITLSSKKQETVVDVLCPRKTTNDPSPVSTRRSGICKDGAGSNSSQSEPATFSSKRFKATVESTSVSLRSSSSSRSGLGSKNEDSSRPYMTKCTSVSSRRSSSTKASHKKIKTTMVRPRRTSSTRDGASPKTTKTADCPINTETPKKAKSTSVPKKAGSIKSRSSPKIPTNDSTPLSRRQGISSKKGSSTKPIKRESNIFSSRSCSKTAGGSFTKNTRSGPNLRVGWPTLAEVVSSLKNGESTPAKKPKLIQEVSGSNNNLRVVTPKKLAKTAKAAENSSSCETVKKFTAKAVWTPPVLPTNTATPAGGERSPHSFVPKETRSQNQTPPLVYPPSVSLHPIPVRAPPVVSPLQPLSVIGWRLLKNQCGECGRVLSSSAALESHVSLHTGRRPFSCTLCGKRFPDSKGLKRHGRVHRNGRIHICQQCGKGFVYSFGLTKHLQMVHSGIKPFVCQVCNKGFLTKRDVEAHVRIHTGEKPFHCNLCEKKFARRTELNVHLRWHNGEKRHWCPYCGKGFLDINNLKRHKYTHTGEKPHSCPHCPKHFTQSGHLKKHVKNVHKIQ